MTGQESMGVLLIAVATAVIVYIISVIIESGGNVYFRIQTCDGKIFLTERRTLLNPFWKQMPVHHTTLDDARAYILKNWDAKKEDIQYRTVYEITTKK